MHHIRVSVHNAGRRAVIWALTGPSQQSRYGLLDGRLFCIFIHRHSWGECPLRPPGARFVTFTVIGSRRSVRA
jgi:hypothetical protein